MPACWSRGLRLTRTASHACIHLACCDCLQALEFAIERGLERVEAGAQGEHKLSRGYLPTLTYSLHYLPDQRFSGVVERCA